MPCSVGSSPRSPTGGTATCQRASSPTCARASSTPLPWPRSPSRSASVNGCCSARARTPPAAGRSRRSCPMRFEAVLGAVYLDGGVDAAKALVDAAVQRATRDRRRPARSVGPQDRPAGVDRSAVRHRARLHADRVGPDHSKTFKATVLVDGTALGNGEGKSKKLAEQQAAIRGIRRALRRRS